MNRQFSSLWGGNTLVRCPLKILLATSNDMTLVYLLIWGTWIVFGISAVWALTWAVSQGHLRDFDGAARSIFDEEEPIGEVTDYFPGAGPDGDLAAVEDSDG